MTSVLTGDIINSKDSNPDKWLESLKQVFKNHAKEIVAWEIFRGDSFQIEINPKYALELAINIKLSIKQHKDIDVRIAIGIGDKTYSVNKITESNGTAFINSGECFDNLKKTTLAIKTPNEDFDYTLNTIFNLALLTIDNWTIKSVKLLQVVFDNPNKNQKEIAKLMNKSQSSISEALDRAGFNELLQVLVYYQYKIENTKW